MATTVKDVAASAADISRDVKDSVVRFGRSAGQSIDVARNQTGGALHAAASSMRRSSAKIDEIATGAAERLDATASFVEDASFKGLFAGARQFGQNHLTLTLLAAAAAGFWAGSILSRATRDVETAE